MPPRKKAEDKQLVDAFLRGLSSAKVAEEVGLSASVVKRRRDALIESGALPVSIRNNLRVPTRAVISDARLLELTKLHGVDAIGAMVGLSGSTILNRLRRLGASDPSRCRVKLPLPRRRYRPKFLEFTDATKRLRFAEEGGICQLCGKPTANWQSATYHHIVLMSRGGGPEPANCMVLHGDCHRDKFMELHGFDYARFSREPSAPRPRQPKVVKKVQRGPYFILINPAGDEFEVTNLSSFCREHDLTSQAIHQVIRGKISNHKRWKARKF